MGSVVEAFYWLARRTTSSFVELRPEAAVRPAAGSQPCPGEPIYRLRRWPNLPSSMRTADVLRLLSLMSNRPVNRSWMLSKGKLPEKRLDRLLQRLSAQGALEVVDPASFPRRAAGAL